MARIQRYRILDEAGKQADVQQEKLPDVHNPDLRLWHFSSMSVKWSASCHQLNDRAPAEVVAVRLCPGAIRTKGGKETGDEAGRFVTAAAHCLRSPAARLLFFIFIKLQHASGC